VRHGCGRHQFTGLSWPPEMEAGALGISAPWVITFNDAYGTQRHERSSIVSSKEACGLFQGMVSVSEKVKQVGSSRLMLQNSKEGSYGTSKSSLLD
jgi:hypothetical protein